MPSQEKKIERACQLARERYAQLDVDVDRALRKLSGICISMHCWQGDDVACFENMGSELGGGLAVTVNYPGKARTPEELKADFEKTVSLIPGRHRFNLHSIYAEMGGKKVERDALGPEQFKNWIAWAVDARNMIKVLLLALLEPIDRLRSRGTTRRAWL